MCGICGKFSTQGVEQAEIQRMAAAISHRGPDDEGFYLDGLVGLGHRRLSIIDLDHGKQPIANEDKSLWIVFNGEIYNYKELKKELVSAGHKFSTNTDTEVIIHLYEDLGERCVEKLTGMFAFAIWDATAQTIFLARDRIGQKPLFYSFDQDSLLFGSEVKAILAANNVSREIDFESIHHYLSLRFIPSPRTMFKKISKLPPGHHLTYQDGEVTVRRYWDLDFRQKLKLKEGEYIELLEETLLGTVESHLISDVPVGAYLSGGMDSSIIVAMMSRFMPEPYKTFAVGVKEDDYNELPYARMVAERYRTDHVEQVIQADLISLLPRMVWQLDEPSDSIAACMYQAAELASRHVKVVLGGDGGDELFAGFDRYVGIGYIDYYTMIPSFLRRGVSGPLINSFRDSFTYKSIPQKMRWMHQLSFFDEGERYAEATAFFRFSHADKEQLYSADLWRRHCGSRSSGIIVEQYNQAKAQTPLDRMLYADFMTRLTEHTLMLTDRMNMAHGVEARSPFLDHPLVELMARFPGDLKIRGKNLKYILRKLGGQYLPETIVKREKQGFMFPVAYWFRNELHDFLKRLFADSRMVNDGLFKAERIAQLIEDHKHNRVDNHVRLWMLLNLEIWHRLYIEQQSPAAVEELVRGYL